MKALEEKLRAARSRKEAADRNLAVLGERVDQACRALGDAKAKFAAASPVDEGFTDLAAAVPLAQAALTVFQERERTQGKVVKDAELDLHRAEVEHATAAAKEALDAAKVLQDDVYAEAVEAGKRVLAKLKLLSNALPAVREKVAAVPDGRPEPGFEPKEGTLEAWELKVQHRAPLEAQLSSLGSLSLSGALSFAALEATKAGQA